MIAEQLKVSPLQYLTRYLFIIILLCITLSIGEVQAEVTKLSNKEKILAKFESGQQKVRVIVGLQMPLHLKGIKSFKDKQFKLQVRAEIAARQSNVLSGLSPNEFVLSHRYKNFECFAGEVTLQGLDKLLAHPLVKSVELSELEHKMLAQGIGLINAMTPRLIYNGQNVTVAISDTGVDYTHPRLGGGGFPNSKVIGGYDTGDNDSNPIPNSQAHGTACAGIAAGDLGTVGDYIGGVGYSAKIYAMKISIGSTGSAYDTDVIEAWDWCIDHQYDDVDNPILIVSHSFGGGRYFSATEAENDRPSYAAAAGRLAAAGITVFAASGNEGYCDSMAAPAAFSSTISVGAVYDADIGQHPEPGYVGCISNGSCAGYTSDCPCDEKCYVDETTAADQVTTYSNSADFLDVFAPSNNAYTTDIVGSGGYESGDYTPDFGGTSAACPYAAGAAACLQSAAKILTGSYLTPQELRDTLVNTGDNIIDSKSSIVKPRVNLQDAINLIQGVETPPDAFDVMTLTQPDTPVIITLDASDEGLPDPPGMLTYVIATLPSKGSLTDPCAGIITKDDVPYTLAENGYKVIYTSIYCYTGSDSFEFKANDGGTEPNAGDSNIAVVTINVRLLPTVIYQTDFEDGIPAGWSIVDGFSDEKSWTKDNPGSRTSSYWTNNFMIVDSDWAGYVDMDEQLITQTIDCSDLQDVTLKFKHYFQYYFLGGNEIGDVDIRVDGGLWQNIARYQNGNYGAAVELSLPSIVDNQPNLQIRWHYYDANFDWYWGIDDIEITASEILEPPKGDMEPDCDVDFLDLSILVDAWLSGTGDSNWCPHCDISEPNDNIINFLDFQVFTNNWLEGK